MFLLLVYIIKFSCKLSHLENWFRSVNVYGLLIHFVNRDNKIMSLDIPIRCDKKIGKKSL